MVSVIIPIYNVENFLPKCIDSVLNQTYHDIEVILVDDGSTDSCGKICDEYELKDARIRVIHKSNGGLSDARNVGIDASSGEVITYLDSDDMFISNEAIEVMYNLMKRENADMCIMNYLSITEDDAIIPEIGVSSYEEINRDIDVDKYRLIDEKEFWDWKIFNRDRIRDTVVWGKMYKRNIIDAVRMPVGVGFEDEHTIYDIVRLCSKIAVSDYIVIGYRQRSTSLLHESFSAKNLDKAEAIVREIEIFQKRGWNEYGLPLFLDGSSIIVKAYATRKKIGLDDRRNKLYQRYKKCAKRICKCEYIPWSRKIQLKIFIYSIPLYRIIRNAFAKRKI